MSGSFQISISKPSIISFDFRLAMSLSRKALYCVAVAFGVPVRASATETDFTVTGGSTAADDERDFRGGKGARGQTFSLRETALFRNRLKKL
mgnify:CR=1 FL=1